jgi:hypothetical protein
MTKNKKNKKLTLKDLKKVKGGITKVKGNDYENKSKNLDMNYRNKNPDGISTGKTQSE